MIPNNKNIASGIINTGIKKNTKRLDDLSLRYMIALMSSEEDKEYEIARIKKEESLKLEKKDKLLQLQDLLEEDKISEINKLLDKWVN